MRPDLDLLLCATVTPDMMFPTSSALLADTLGARDAAAYDLLAGCTGFMYALVQAYGMMAAGLADRALVVGGDVLSRILDWTDRSTVVLFGDGAGAVVLEKVDKPGFLGFELGADGGGGIHLSLPGSGSRRIEDASANGFVHMNGREVFKFATQGARLVGGSRPGTLRRLRSRTSTSTSLTRPTSGSWITPPRSSGSRGSAWSLTLTATAIRPRGRFRLLWRKRRQTGGSRKETWC